MHRPYVAVVSLLVLAALLTLAWFHHTGGRRAGAPGSGGLGLGRRRALQHQVHHDDLTGLPNRPLALDRLRGALARGRRRGSSCGVLIVDLDRFKTVNDSMGHRFGDRLLVEVAMRLDGCVRPEDTVARFGGDEFLVLLEDIDGRDEAARVAGRIAEALGPSFTIRDQEVFVTISAGCAISDAGCTADDLLRDAGIALGSAKERGPGGFEVFESYMRGRATERLDLETSLRHAIERGELELLYQPQVGLHSGRIVAAEALLRWHHPERGLVSPNDFIPIAEESGLILPIGRWVLEQACHTAASWESGDGAPTVSVNLSARQFAQPGLAEEVVGALEGSGLDPGRLCLEITESVVMREVDLALETMRRLKEIGVALSLDDFGKGHSSLSSLKRFPLDRLKVDRSFVSEMAGDDDTEAIVRALVSLAHTLGMRVVAEGIESELQLRRLRDLDCDVGQGFHLARPLGKERLRAMIAGDRPLGTAR